MRLVEDGEVGKSECGCWLDAHDIPHLRARILAQNFPQRVSAIIVPHTPRMVWRSKSLIEAVYAISVAQTLRRA